MLAVRLVKILGLLGVSSDALLAKWGELVAKEPDIEKILPDFRAWFEANVSPLAREDAGDLWISAFDETVRRLRSADPGSNPHHGGIA